MILFEEVTKKYGTGTVALDNVTFQVDDNDFVFLVGPSGAGKTTILKMLLRQTIPTSGSILIDDEDITSKKFNKTEHLRQSMGVVFQDFKILFDKNVFENVAIAMRVVGEKPEIIKDEVNKVLDLVGLKDKGDVFPVQLSAGELQRVAIARAVVGDRNVIIADEPTGNLDPKTTWDIMKIFQKLDGKKTILIATHNVDIVNSFKKRVITLKKGKIVKDKRKGKYEL